MVTTDEDWTLTAEDRCDRCGAAAVVQVELGAGDLLFCGHHGRQHGFIDRLPMRDTHALQRPTASE